MLSIINHKINHNINHNINHDINNKKSNIVFKHITIVKVKCLLYIIEIIRNELSKMGWRCDIIDKKEINYYINLNNSEHYFLFLWPLHINDDVIHYKRYILYQLEQNINNQLSTNYEKLHDTKKLKKIYDNAKLLIDYCQLNINVLNQYYSNKFKIMNIPARYIDTNETATNYEYDIIFVGSMNDKRFNILKQLKTKYNVLIVENIYDNELKKLCNKSNICLNIHYYENAILERVRLNEMLEYGIKIISEKPCDDDIDICNYYQSIYFIEMISDSCEELFKTIDDIKSDTDNKSNASDLKHLESIFKQDIHSLFTF